MKIEKWGEMSRGEMSFGEKRRTCANFGKKWGEMIFGEKRRREKCRGQKRHLGRNVFPPYCPSVSHSSIFISFLLILLLIRM